MKPSPTNHQRVRLCAVHPCIAFGFALLAIGLAASFVPNSKEVAQRLFKDGSHLRGLQAAVAQPEEATANLDQMAKEEASQTLKAALADPAKLKTLCADSKDRALLAEGVLTHSAPTEKVAELFSAARVLADGEREKLLRSVAARALDQGHPEVAALLFNKLMQLRPEKMSAEVVREVTRSWRANSQPAEALACLEVWLAAAEKRGEVAGPEFFEQRIQLLFETNDASRALDLLLAALQTEQRVHGIQPATLLRAVEAAGYCGRIMELRPHVRAFLKTTALGKANLAEMCASARAGSEPAEAPVWRRLASDLAHWCEWSGAPQEALPIYEKLAVLGDAAALRRATALANELGDKEDLLLVFDTLIPMGGWDEFVEPYAKLLGLAGRLEEAASQYQSWMKTKPKDAAARADYAALCEEQGKLEDARLSWMQAASLQPENLEFRKRLAEVSIDLRLDAEALAIYQQLGEKEHDSTTLENLALLAESRGDYALLSQALLWRFGRLSHPHAADYLEVANSFALAGQSSPRIQWLHRGLAAHPDNLNLRRQLASALEEAERNFEAVDVLEIASTKMDLRSLSIYIVGASQTGQYSRAAKFLGPSLHNTDELPSDVRLHLAHICFHTNRNDEARRLYETVASNEATWPLLAQTCYHLGSYAEAENYQRKYIADLDPVPAGQFKFLGDICRAKGDEAAAESAYDLALKSIRSKHEETERVFDPKISSTFPK